MNGARQDTAVCALLPWYVAGTLDTREEQQVQSHLGDCENCASDLLVLRAARDQMHLMPVPIVPEPDLSAFRGAMATGNTGMESRHDWQGGIKSVPKSAALAAGIALAAAVTLWLAAPVFESTPAIYQTVSDGSVTSVERYVLEVEFAPGVSGAEGRRLMEQAGAVSASPAGNGRLAVVFAASSASFADIEARRDALLENGAIVGVRLRAVEPTDPVR